MSSALSPSLCSGSTQACFHVEGKHPEDREELISVNGGAITDATDFRMLSGSVQLLVCNALMRSKQLPFEIA